MAPSRIPADQCRPNSLQVSSRQRQHFCLCRHQRHVLLLTGAAQPGVVTPTLECEGMCIPMIHLDPWFTYYETIIRVDSRLLVYVSAESVSTPGSLGSDGPRTSACTPRSGTSPNRQRRRPLDHRMWAYSWQLTHSPLLTPSRPENKSAGNERD